MGVPVRLRQPTHISRLCNTGTEGLLWAKCLEVFQGSETEFSLWTIQVNCYAEKYRKYIRRPPGES